MLSDLRRDAGGPAPPLIPIFTGDDESKLNRGSSALARKRNGHPRGVPGNAAVRAEAGAVGSKTVAPTELVDLPSRIQHFLLAGVERMALGADIQVHFVACEGRLRLKGSAAAAGDLHFVVLGVDIRFHFEARVRFRRKVE